MSGKYLSLQNLNICTEYGPAGRRNPPNLLKLLFQRLALVAPAVSQIVEAKRNTLPRDRPSGRQQPLDIRAI